MPFIETPIPGLLVFEPAVFSDKRGYFFESYNKQLWEKEGHHFEFVQDNQSKSSYGVIRGLHFQLAPYAQTKLVRVLSGKIIDAVVDLRRGSPTYGKSFSIELSDENKKQLLVPRGFAHGYSVLSETAEILYKCDQFYHREAEGGLRLDDAELQIDWGIPLADRIIADKDLVWPLFRDCEHNFTFNQ